MLERLALDEIEQLQLLIAEPSFSHKLMRMDTLGMKLCSMLDTPDLILQRSDEFPEGRWRLAIYWFGRPTTFVKLLRWQQGWFRCGWQPVLSYRIDHATGVLDESRHLFLLRDEVVRELDALSDELELYVISVAGRMYGC